VRKISKKALDKIGTGLLNREGFIKMRK